MKRRESMLSKTEIFLPVTKVRFLVKLFENGLTLKEEVKLASWKRKSALGVPPRKVTEIS